MMLYLMFDCVWLGHLCAYKMLSLSLSLSLIYLWYLLIQSLYIYFFPRFSKLSTYIGFNWYISLLYMSCIYKPGSEKDMCSRPLCSMGRDVFRDMSCPVRARCIVFGRWDYSRGVPWIVGVSHESYVDCAMLVWPIWLKNTRAPTWVYKQKENLG